MRENGWAAEQARFLLTQSCNVRAESVSTRSDQDLPSVSMTRRPLLLETFEDRILCSATAPIDPVPIEKPADPIAVSIATATATATHEVVSPAPADGAQAAAAATPAAQLTDAERTALEGLIKDSTSKIWFQENVGQFADGVRYGFKTDFGGMLVYDDHLRIVSNQTDPVTGEVGLHLVDVTFSGSTPWQIVPGSSSGVSGAYQRADGTALTPHIFQEITLRNVYAGIDLRLYSAEQGVLEFDWLVAKAQDYEKIRLDFHGQDGLVFNPDGSAALDMRFNDLSLKIPEVYQVVNGEKQLLGASMVAGETAGQMRYALTGNLVADQPLVIDPSVAWSTYFDLNDAAFDSYLYAIAVNANGVYAMGWTAETITNGSFGNYMEVSAGFAQGSVGGQNYIYRLNTAGTNITAWTSTGLLGSSGNNPPSDLELFPDGRVLALFSDGRMQIYSANLANRSFDGEPVNLSAGNALAIVDNNNFYVSGIVSAAIPAGELAAARIGPDAVFAGATEGAIIRYSNATATPTANWATYVGGDAAERFTAIALTPDGKKLTFATFTEAGTLASYPTLVKAVDSTLGGATELLVGVLNEQSTVPAAFDVFSFLGGSSTEGTTAAKTAASVVTAVNGGFWVGGNTASIDLPGAVGGAQAVNGGGTNDAFISFIPIAGNASSGFQSTYLGGSGNELIGGIAYDPIRDRILVFGTTTGAFPVLDTTPTSLYYDSTFGGPAGGFDIFIATFSGTLKVKDYATYVGGIYNDYLGDTGLLRGQGHVTYSATTDQVYLATTVHSNLPPEVVGLAPGKDTTRSNPESSSADAHVILAFNINIFDHGDAPASYEAGNPAAEAISRFIRIGNTVDPEPAAISGSTATGDDFANNGSANDEDGVLVRPLLFTSDTSYAISVSVLNNTGAAQTLQGWIDFNGDGIFSANERATVSVPANAAQQSVTLNWASLSGLVSGQSYLRLRFTDTISADDGATSIDERSIGTDLTGHGEVEDYALTINAISSLSGFVYSELNGNSTKDVFEGGIPGVQVKLTGTNLRGTVVSQTTMTNAVGQYVFSNLLPSNAAGYTITETVTPAGYTDGPDNIGSQGGAAGNDVLSAILISNAANGAGVNGVNNNFGESPTFGLTKSLQTTSVAGTSGTNLSIGETATFRLVVTVPAGAFANFQFLEALPSGFQFLNGSAVVALVSSAGQLTSSTLSGAGLWQTSIGTPTFALPDAAVSTSATSNADAYSSGTDVFFKLGNLSNADTNGATTESVVIEFQAVVVNELANQPGALLPNAFSVLFDKDGVGAPDPHGSSSNVVTTQVVEPNVTITKVANLSSNVDAGDVITYTVTLTNPAGGAATAYDTLLVDSLPSNLRVTGITSTTLAGGATTDSAVAITGGGTGLTGQFDLPVGATVTLVYTATVQQGFPPNGSLTNGAVLTWTSVDGGNSTAPDANERFGAAGSIFGDGSLNDFRRTTSATTTGAGPSFSKLLFSTSDPLTFGSNVTVGEQVTYALVVTLPEGTTTGFNAADALPPGLRFVSSSLVTSAAASNGLLTSDFTGTVPAPVVTGGVADGDDVTFTFAPITTTGDNVGNNNTFLILVTAVVTDVPGNSGVALRTVLPNSATFGGIGIPPITPPTVNVTVAEPRLQITKGVDDATADLGQTLTYTVTITHTASSTAAAYDLILRDAIPSGLTLNPSSISVVGGTVATDASTSALLALTIDQLNVGGTITITYTATVGTAAALGGTIQDNNARLYWDTTSADTGSNAALSGSPDGDEDRDFGAIAGYTEAPTPAPDDPAQDTVRVTVNSNSVSGFVYRDTDNSGSRDGAESGLGVGVSVTISGTTFFGGAFSQTVTANAATGAYTFTNVPRSDATGYTITEIQPGGFVDGIETAGSLGGTTNNLLGADSISGVVVPADSVAASGYNFGEVLGSSLSGFTYLDSNNDGVKQISEAGLGTALPVTLSGTDIFGQPVLISTSSSAATGAYSFAGLRPSSGSGYTIAEDDAAVVPTTFFDGKDTVGSLGGTVVGGSPKFDAINVTTGQNQIGTGYNFAEINPSSFSGNVFADLDNDGVFDAFERGIPGVLITLTGTDDQGAPVSLTVTTNASGAYTFANLRPSNGSGYAISETQPADYLDGVDTIGTQGGTSGNDTFTTVVLGAGVQGGNNNFGEAPNFALTKSLVNTSEAGTGGSQVAIGEVATFRLVVTIPAGALTDFQVRDFLPAGYVFVNGSARAGLVGDITSSTIFAPLATIGATPTVALGDAAVSNNATNNTDSYASGSDVFFKFGDVTNLDTTAAVEAIVIEFDARVVNEATNFAGVALPNSFGVLYDRDGNLGPEPDSNPPATPPTVTTTVVSPVLSFAKTANPTGALQAGDSVTYTLTLTNLGGAFGATAFDALVQDTMPADIRTLSIMSTALAGGATVDLATAITGGGAGLTGRFDIPVGASVTITYVGTLQVSAAPGSAQTNNAELTWTSLNGGNSLAPDGGERFGAPGTLFGDGTLNNLRRVDSQTVTVATATFGKQLYSTSDPATPGSRVAIGETVTYALVVTLPAGTAPALSIIDTLPAGLQFITSAIVTSAAASNGLLAGDFNGTVPTPTIGGGASDGDDVSFDFSAIVANADGISSNNTFLILVTARVTDVPGNTSLTPLSNTAIFDIPGDGVPPTTPPPVTVTVVEPQLRVTKAIDDATPDLGQRVHFTITIGHTASSLAPAFDLLVRDALPSGLAGLTNIVVTGANIDSDASTSTLLDLKLDRLDVGAFATVEFDAVVSSAASVAGVTIENNARIFWDTQAAESANRVLTSVPDADDDRDYGASGADELFRSGHAGRARHGALHRECERDHGLRLSGCERQRRFRRG